MYIKIFFDARPLFLCDAIDEVIEPFVHHDDAIFIDELNSHTIKAMIHEMGLPRIKAGVFFHPDFEELKKAFFKKYTLITAAGGMVQNEKKELLLIFRRGKWDLPKGKLDKGEKIEVCAIREVEEETGLKDVKIIAPLRITYHTYHEGTKFILKTSHWYKMKVKGNQELIPQTEEDIHDIKWVKAEEIPGFMKNSYPLIAELLSAELNKS